MHVAEQTERMQQVADTFRDAVQDRNVEALVSCFAEDCEVELLNLKLHGRDGVRKWYHWMCGHMKSTSFEHVCSAVNGSIYIEEYIMHGVIHNGKKMHNKQTRVLEFNGDKIKSFRLYLDRLQFADSVVNDFAGKIVVRKFIEISVKGMK